MRSVTNPESACTSKVTDQLDRFCQEQGLPASFAHAGHAHLWPLAQWIAQRRQAQGTCLIVGINGAQGSGKSTLAALLQRLLGVLGLHAAVLSIDDLYLSRSARRRLAEQVHPLLITRGVPGTHDLALGVALLQRLRTLAPGQVLALPRFDKLADEPAPQAAWPLQPGPVDVVLFEGWCVGTPAQTRTELQLPVNALEQDEDADGRWRTWVNNRLERDYPQLFGPLDCLIFLRTPDFERVFAWRQQQETQLAGAAGHNAPAAMNRAALRRFIQHFERLSRHALTALPPLADVCLELRADHSIAAAHYRAARAPRPPAAD